MNNLGSMSLALTAGLLLGAFFFGGLWWTVRKGISSQHPALWFFASMLLRMSVALGGFYFVGRGNWLLLVACLVGFLVGRLFVTWLTRTRQEAGHAS